MKPVKVRSAVVNIANPEDPDSIATAAVNATFELVKKLMVNGKIDRTWEVDRIFVTTPEQTPVESLLSSSVGRFGRTCVVVTVRDKTPEPATDASEVKPEAAA